MSVKIIQVDAFTSRPFSGNPAAVCVMEKAAEESWMQSVANEMNLSETAFLFPENDGYRLRWFTPTTEVDLCGHATLASAHVLFEDNHVARGSEIIFHTRSGALGARQSEGKIELRFPTTAATEISAPEKLLEALGSQALWVGQTTYDFLVEVDSEQTLRGLAPDFAELAKLDARGVIVTTASAGSRYDFLSRYFAPAFGINEDPVTGSTHCALGKYWARKLGKKSLNAYQASSRGGEMSVIVDGEQTILGGAAVIVMRGELL